MKIMNLVHLKKRENIIDRAINPCFTIDTETGEALPSYIKLLKTLLLKDCSSLKATRKLVA